MNKEWVEEAKTKIVMAGPTYQTWVHRPYIHVLVTATVEGVTYEGHGFSKWSTEDQGAIQQARHSLRTKRLTRWQQEDLHSLIRRLRWDEQRGRDIAEGKALGDMAGKVARATLRVSAREMVANTPTMTLGEAESRAAKAYVVDATRMTNDILKAIGPVKDIYVDMSGLKGKAALDNAMESSVERQ